MEQKWMGFPQVVDIFKEAVALAKADRSPVVSERHMLLSLLRFDSVWRQFCHQDELQQLLFRQGKTSTADAGEALPEPELPVELKDAFCLEAEQLRTETEEAVPTPEQFVQALFIAGSDRLRQTMTSFRYGGDRARRRRERRDSRHRGHGLAEIPESAEEALAAYTVELVARAKAKKGWPVSGREQESLAVMRTLLRRQKCCPVLVGAAGVGKTSVVEALAWRIASGEVPDAMKEAKIYSLNAGALIGGAVFRGEYEGRLRSVVEAVKQEKGGILFVDELHALMTSGTNHGDAMTAGNILKPELAAGELKFIGATTEDEYRKFIEADSAMERRFTPILVQEPSRDACLKMLRNGRPAMEAYYQTKLSDQIYERALDLVQAYIPQRHLPDKVFDVLEEAAADQLLQGRKDDLLTEERLEAAVARVARLPHLPRQSQDQFSALRTLADELKKKVFGQDEAISCLTRAVKLAESGLFFAARGTRGAFFFNGSTGVGKTEIARQLAQLLNLKLVRFDMSEYSTDASVSRLIGAAPGLVGYDEGGLLVNAIRETPNCVLLLDEIEKAHPAIHRLLLQVMDAGILTDNHGRVANFKQVYLIMTGNVKTYGSSPMGFGKTQDKPDKPDLADSFAPEFRSRLTASVQFNALGRAELTRIVMARFGELRDQASEKGLVISLADSARDELVRQTLEREEGARPIAPLLEQVAAMPLVERMIDGESQASLSLVFENDAFRYE